MSLRELTLEELMLVAGGEGEGNGNGGDSPGTGSAGAGDGQGNGASGGGIGTGGGMASAGGYGFGPAPQNAQVASLQSSAINVGLGILGNMIYDAGKAIVANGPYGPQNPGSSLGVPSGPDPVGTTPQDGYGVDGQRSSGPGG